MNCLIAQMQLCCVEWKETLSIGKDGNKYFVEYCRDKEGYTRTFMQFRIMMALAL